MSIKMKNRKIFFLLITVFLCACNQDSDTNSSFVQKATQDNPYTDGPIVLGEEIQDPYRLENMQKALLDLHYDNAPITSIKPNFKYVRLKPANETQFDQIQQDTNLLLWSFPLNYEILVNGTYYHDPTVPENEITWQYCVVPLNYDFPTGITTETLYYVFIPPKKENKNFYDALERTACKLASAGKSVSSEKSSSWTPSATIRAYDDVIGSCIPLEGVKVIARRGTKTATGFTNSSGYCQLDNTFTDEVNYSIKWERAYWDIRDGALGQAYYNGPKKNSTWNLNIYKTTGKSILYATVHRAALKFYYGNTLGVTRPILSTGKTKIGVLDNNPSWGTGCCWGTWSFTGALPDILIAHPHESTLTDKVFATTIHELAHQSHLLFMGLSTYAQLAKEIHESWADAVAWKLTSHHYQSDLYQFTNGVYNCLYNNQTWQPGTKSDGKSYCYTPLFIDLMDTLNQIIVYGNNRPNDIISGYTLGYIQNNILISSYGLSSFRDALKTHKLNNITNADIDLLMSLYWGYDYTR